MRGCVLVFSREAKKMIGCIYLDAKDDYELSYVISIHPELMLIIGAQSVFQFKSQKNQTKIQICVTIQPQILMK